MFASVSVLVPYLIILELPLMTACPGGGAAKMQGAETVEIANLQPQQIRIFRPQHAKKPTEPLLNLLSYSLCPTFNCVRVACKLWARCEQSCQHGQNSARFRLPGHIIFFVWSFFNVAFLGSVGTLANYNQIFWAHFMRSIWHYCYGSHSSFSPRA